MLKEFMFGTSEEVSIHDWLWALLPYGGLAFILLSTIWGLKN